MKKLKSQTLEIVNLGTVTSQHSNDGSSVFKKAFCVRVIFKNCVTGI